MTSHATPGQRDDLRTDAPLAVAPVEEMLRFLSRAVRAISLPSAALLVRSEPSAPAHANAAFALRLVSTPLLLFSKATLHFQKCSSSAHRVVRRTIWRAFWRRSVEPPLEFCDSV